MPMVYLRSSLTTWSSTDRGSRSEFFKPPLRYRLGHAINI
jgi:hypothetical protein